MIYNWGKRAGTFGQVRVNLVGNYIKPGPSSRPTRFYRLMAPPFARVFAAHNHIAGQPGRTRNNWRMMEWGGDVRDDMKPKYRAGKPFPVAAVRTHSATEAYKRVLANAGATLPRRDAVDRRIVREVRTGEGRIIDSQNDVRGWPEYKSAAPPADTDRDGMPDAWEKKQALDPADPSDNAKDADGDGYTNVEEFLNRTDPRTPE